MKIIELLIEFYDYIDTYLKTSRHHIITIPFWIRGKFDQQIFIGHFSSNFYLTFQKLFIADVYIVNLKKSQIQRK